MEKAQFQNELDYGVAMALAREMLDYGVIDRQDFLKVDKIYVDCYSPVIRPITQGKSRQD